MTNLKTVIVVALFIVLAIGGAVYFERNLGIPRLVWGGPLCVLLLSFVLLPMWGSYDKPRKIMVALLLVPITLLVGGVIVDAYVWEFFEYSRIYLFMAIAPFLIYGAWHTLVMDQKQDGS